MKQFEIFRVSDWFDDDGMLKSFQVLTGNVMAAVKAGAVATLLGAATLVSMPVAASAVAWPADHAPQEPGVQEPAVDTVARISARMAARVDNFMSPDLSDLDPKLLEAVADFLKVVRVPS
jgi:hypothetical protein